MKQGIRRSIIAVALAVCVAGVFTSGSAEAATETVQWAGYSAKYHLESGQNGFTNYDHWMFGTQGYSSEAANCSGIRGVGDACAGVGSFSSYTSGSEWFAEAYLHDHSTFGAYFQGWFTYTV